MRVMLVVATLEGPAGSRSIGPGRVMTTLAEELIALGHEPVVVSAFGPRRSSLVSEIEAAGIPVEHLGMDSMWDPRGAARFLALVRKLKPDVVHTRTVRADLLGRLAARHGAAVVNNIVNLYPDDSLTWHGPVKGRVVLAIFKWTTRPVNSFVANAAALTESIATAFGVGRDRIEVVHDGIRLEHFSEAAPADLESLGVGPDDPVCLTVARLHPQKGIGDLIEAAGEIVKRRPDVRFVVVGEGPLRAALEETIAAAGLQSNVILAGFRDDVPGLLARATLFVLPSHFEGLPNAVIEAMAAGLPVVATAVAGTPELVEEGVTGWLVPARAPARLAEALELALAGDLDAIGKAARARAETHFSARAMALGFESIYERLLTQAGLRSSRWSR